MAPVLALLSYAITGLLVTPEQTERGKGRLLVIGSCQPTENACLMTHGQFELKLLSADKQQQQQLAFISNQPINDLSVALGSDQTFRQFPLMKSDDGKYWQIKLSPKDQLKSFNQLRLAFNLSGDALYTETAVRF